MATQTANYGLYIIEGTDGVNKQVFNDNMTTIDTKLKIIETEKTEDVTALEERVTAAETNITTNMTDIATLKSSATTQAADIGELGTTVATNTTNIAANTTDITTLQSQMDAAESNISTNTAGIATLTSGLSALQAISVERAVVFTGTGQAIPYPWAGTIKQIQANCSTTKTADIPFYIETMSKTDYAAGSTTWTRVGGTDFAMYLLTSDVYAEYGSTELTANTAIAAGDLLRITIEGTAVDNFIVQMIVENTVGG